MSETNDFVPKVIVPIKAKPWKWKSKKIDHQEHEATACNVFSANNFEDLVDLVNENLTAPAK